MRRPLVAGNWKMHTTAAEAAALAAAVTRAAANARGVDVVIAPPFTALAAVHVAAADPVAVAAQDMHWAAEGAFTGEVSPGMVGEFATYVIVGHSERRTLFHETDADVNRKVHAAFDHDLTPIVCLGETEAERDEGRTDVVVHRQLEAAVEGVRPREAERLVIAYEPVWAIGTGRACPADEAGRVAADLRGGLRVLFTDEVARSARILYGGSMSPDNARPLLRQGDVDGGLVGGASLDADAFAALMDLAESAA